jgi:hypothetical protein
MMACWLGQQLLQHCPAAPLSNTIAGADPHRFHWRRAVAIPGNARVNPGKALRFVFDALWELLQEMEDRAFVNAMDRPRPRKAFPLVRRR